MLIDSPQDSLVAEEQFIELTVVLEAHVSHYRSHLGVGCLVVFDPLPSLGPDRTPYSKNYVTSKPFGPAFQVYEAKSENLGRYHGLQCSLES